MEKIKMLEELSKLKVEKDVVILAHFYTDEQVQEVADYVGDSFYLAKVAKKVKNKTICFAGVKFMAESAKILNPDKNVILVDLEADCPMAHMVDLEKIKYMRQKYDDLAVVSYINSTALTKSYVDVCVTSSNAVKVVSKLPNKNIYFIPDKNLGSFISKKLPDKNFILNDGFCPIHHVLLKEDILKVKKKHKNSSVLAHPECRQEVLEQAEFIGSTSEIIEYAEKSNNKEFIIATEMGVLVELRRRCPNKNFYSATDGMICKNMKKNSVFKLLECIKYERNMIEVESNISKLAYKSLEKMLDFANC